MGGHGMERNEPVHPHQAAVFQRAPQQLADANPPEEVFVASLPSMASQDYHLSYTAFEPGKEDPAPRSMLQRWGELFYNWYGTDYELSRKVGERFSPMPVRNWTHYFTKSMFPLKPELYVDAYTAPNKCPEEWWWNPWRWPLTKRINPKIPPPVDGMYNDFYHYLAFKQFIAAERVVYWAHVNLLAEMAMRCSVREGVNANKNCRHFASKHFAMTRHEEVAQTLMYMSITGNVAIRETPYPEDFVQQKRKIYNDWLTRTRMKMPGDMY